MWQVPEDTCKNGTDLELAWICPVNLTSVKYKQIWNNSILHKGEILHIKTSIYLCPVIHLFYFIGTYKVHIEENLGVQGDTCAKYADDHGLRFLDYDNGDCFVYHSEKGVSSVCQNQKAIVSLINNLFTEKMYLQTKRKN